MNPGGVAPTLDGKIDLLFIRGSGRQYVYTRYKQTKNHSILY